MKTITKWITEKVMGNDSAARLKRKWLKNKEVCEWEKNGWLDETENVEYLLSQWEAHNEPVPPPHRVKEAVLLEYSRYYKYDMLIETGTYLGRMVDAQKGNFKEIISVEIDKTLHENAMEKFKMYPHIKFYFGDSGKVLNEIVSQLDKPALFWLDAHYCHKNTTRGDKECPIYEELDAIFRAKDLDHTLLIDDARLFVGKNDYPAIPELSNYIKKKNPAYSLRIKNDIIRIEKSHNA